MPYLISRVILQINMSMTFSWWLVFHVFLCFLIVLLVMALSEELHFNDEDGCQSMYKKNVKGKQIQIIMLPITPGAGLSK